MKITDTTDRQMSVNIVSKATGQYLPPLEFTLDNSRRVYLRTGSGQVAFQAMSRHATEVILFAQGRMLVAPRKLNSGVNLIEVDDSGNRLSFKDGKLIISEGNSQETTDETQVCQLKENLSQLIPSSDNVIVAVLRFAKENTGVHEPPQQEYIVTFELNDPDTHDYKFACNFSHVVYPGDLIDPEEAASTSDEKPTKIHFGCTCTGCRR